MAKAFASYSLLRRLAIAALCVASYGCAPHSSVEPGTTGQTIVPGGPQQPELTWFVGGMPSADARTALSVLSDAESQGLRPEDYAAPALARAFNEAANTTDTRTPATSGTLAKLDADLTAAIEHYLSDLNDGRLSPDALSHRFKAPKTRHFDAAAYLARARAAGRLADAILSAQPRIPMYEALREAMNAYRRIGDHPAWHTPLAPLPGNSIKPGDTYADLPKLVIRLKVLDDLPADVEATNRYEAVIADGVRRFQVRHGLAPDGIIGQDTLMQLNVSPAQRVEQMALTLERLRWTPSLYGPRMVAINIPEFVLRAYEQQGDDIKLELEMRVVVGRALDTRTPIFLEEMRFIEFSPYWNVPTSIAKAETLPRLRRDPGYFAREGFEFVTRNGTVIGTLSREGIEAVQRGEWRIRQRPGPRNALGAIKFIFPNDHNIFLHHTPAPELFSKVRRDFSHGCIRIEYPVALAQFVLRNKPEWTVERIQEAMRGGKSRTLRLDEPIPVLIAYSTAVVKDGGKVFFFPDIYQQDALLEHALREARPNSL